MAIRNQQEQVKAAEIGMPNGNSFGDLDEVREYMAELRRMSWWSSMVPPCVAAVEIGPAIKGSGESVGWFDKEMNAGRIELDVGALNESTILHELAHVLAIARFDENAHGPRWADLYMRLVYQVMGSEVYLQLYNSFKEHGVESA